VQGTPYLQYSFLSLSLSLSLARSTMYTEYIWSVYLCRYGVATISRLLKMIGLFCRILSLLWVSFAKETYHFKEPTNRSHPILCARHTIPSVWFHIRLLRKEAFAERDLQDTHSRISYKECVSCKSHIRNACKTRIP